MEPAHRHLRGRKEPGGSADAKPWGWCGGWGDLPEASLYSLETPRTCDSLALMVRLVDIYLGLILIESFPADDCFTAIRCPEVAGPCKIEVYLQALDSSLHTHRTIVTHHCN